MYLTEERLLAFHGIHLCRDRPLLKNVSTLPFAVRTAAAGFRSQTRNLLRRTLGFF
jgi:hypothetical protein